MAIVSGGLIVANEGIGLNLPSESVMTIAALVASYIIGESYIDSKNVSKDKK